MLLPLVWGYCVKKKKKSAYFENYGSFAKQCLEVEGLISGFVTVSVFINLENMFKMESVRLQKLSGDRTKCFNIFCLAHKKD